jgi:TolB-like protein/Tfp pilus assembly protein PilF
MSSIIDGYNYDIFISYRQKDNKHDGWVTEFVDNLKGELEATFKEDVSVYFDSNPHDGLLESHNVDKSLEDKLKCLIFIPIISQTYCDTYSFAWQHEFVAFNKLAKEDLLGRDIRLASGNVASRVLPVKIHELDPEDKALLENELGGVLRSVDFIYKASGVNRPLKPNDERLENLNHTYYRDQINKMANAVKEIMAAIKKHNRHYGEVSKEVDKTKSDAPKKLKVKIITGSLLVMVLIAFGYFFIHKLSPNSDSVEKSIVVLPFENWNKDEEYVYMGDAIANEINTQLSKIKEFHVFPYMSSSKYSGSDKTSIPQIGKKLGANFIIEGAVERQDEDVSIQVQVIQTKNDNHIFADEFKGKWKDIFTIRTEIAGKIAELLKTILTTRELENIGEKPTDNLEAYNLYLKGRYFWSFRTRTSLLKAIDFFNQAVKLDSNYVLAYTGLADSYIMLPWYSTPSSDSYLKAEQAALKALEIDNSLAVAHATMGFIKYSKWEIALAEEEYLKAIELDPDYATAHHWYALLLASTGRFDQAINEILEARKHDPLSLIINKNTGVIFISARQYDKGIEALKRVIEIDSSFSDVQTHLARAYLNKGMYENALSEIQKSKEQIWTGIIYAQMGHMDKARQILDEFILLSKSQYISPFKLAILFFSLGSEEQGFSSLEKAYEIHDLQLTEIRTYPELDKFTSNPRFIDLLKKMGLER